MRISSKNFLISTGLLSGTIIGAGIFSLPYVFKTTGLLAGIFYLILGATVYIVIYRMYAEVITKTPGDHRFVGYTRMYLGEGASLLAVLMAIVQTILVLTIYLILSQSFANLITGPEYGLASMIVFWLIGSTIIFIGARRLAWLESIITIGMIAVILIIFILGLVNGRSFLDGGALPDWGKFLLPLAPILFSLAGRQAIPDLVKLNGDYKKPIFFGVVIPAIVYLIFVLSIWALSPVVTQDAVSGLVGNVSTLVVLAVVGFFGILSLISSYGTVGMDVYESLEFDLKFPLWLRASLIIFGPLVLYFAGLQSFITLVSFVGGIFLALEGIFIVWMWRKATKKPLSLLATLTLAVFVVALIYEILK